MSLASTCLGNGEKFDERVKCRPQRYSVAGKSCGACGAKTKRREHFVRDHLAQIQVHLCVIFLIKHVEILGFEDSPGQSEGHWGLAGYRGLLVHAASDQPSRLSSFF